MDDDTNEAKGRRITRRGRAGFAFSRSGIADASKQEGPGGSDDLEDDDLNEMVEQRARERAAPTPPSSGGQVLAGPPAEEFNPSARLQQVRARSSQYEREYRLELLHRLLMRRVPIDEIAAQMGLSVSQVYRDRDELRRRLRTAANELNIEEIIGDSKGYYEEVAAMAMRAASNSNLPMPMRLGAMRTALAAKNDQHRFFQTAGVYDVLRFRVAQDGSGMSDVRRLMDNTERVLNGEPLDFSNTYRDVADSGDQENIEL